MNDLDIWNDAADAWASKVSASGTLRDLYFRQAIKTLVGSVNGLKVLDAGCGDGVFSDLLQQQGGQVTAIDGAQEMVKIAKSKYPSVSFAVSDLLQPLEFQNESFDLVFANMVLMHLGEVKTFFTEAKRVLKPNGKLIFSVLHPAFNYPTMKLHKNWLDKLMFKKPSGLSFDYFQNSVSRRFESTMSKELTHYHRTLEQYSTELQKAGFVIEQMAEPHELDTEFLKNNPKLEYTTRLPRFLFIKCIKHV